MNGIVSLIELRNSKGRGWWGVIVSLNMYVSNWLAL
jgi:hypothetical protein